MKIIFFGTPSFVIPIAQALDKVYNIRFKEPDFIAVVTKAPSKAGRDLRIERSAIDNWAYKNKIQVIYDLDKLPPADLGILAAYGAILPQSTISHFPLGILNIHPSLLPKHRGASPVQAAINEGENQTGVTIIKMDEKMDHGPIVSQFKEEILPDDTTQSLEERLFAKSAQFLIDSPRGGAGLIPAYVSGKIKLKEQNHSKATFTNLIKKEDGFVEFKDLQEAINSRKNSQKIERLIRAMYPWPGAFTNLKFKIKNLKLEKRLKILKAHIEDEKLVLDEVQLEGKTPVSWKQFKETLQRSN